MIPANGAQYANYLTTEGLPGPTRPVLAWDDSGAPLVRGKQGLIPAADIEGFDGVRQDSAGIVGAVPGAGWIIESTDDEGTKRSTPILAWTIHTDGTATPLTPDREGVTYDATHGLTDYCIYHPDETVTPPKKPSATWDRTCSDCFGSGWLNIPEGDPAYDPKHPNTARRCHCYKLHEETSA